jgi:hypothetical protein
MDGDEAGAGNFRRGARDCGKPKKVIEAMIESSCASVGIGFLGIGFLNDLFYGPRYIAGPAEMSSPFLLDEKPSVVPVGSAGERSGGARKASYGAARSNS